MTNHLLDGVSLLIPARFRRAHSERARALLSELTAEIAAQPTAALADADTDAAKAWALRVIQALPTEKGDSDGTD
ncbi:hypothetical protein [Methylobacterium radiotolerans]|uniref:hypothetical protein n=1 Tax=Methylobacterium radiotolerans TaxID=31998 RepID=UPI000977E5F9|nr:hypothetical protein [Methylobacterium radiotolerans]ONF49436.1 hypothetical protein RSM1_09180 [Methylobacterium radiotolerans]